MSNILNKKRISPSPKKLEFTSNSNEQKIHKAKSQQNLLEITMDQSKIQQQLLKQIQLAQQVIYQYSRQIQHRSFVKPSNNRSACIASLFEFQRQIQSKNSQINIINNQIKMLKRSPDQVCKDAIKKYKTIKNLQLFKLADQISQQREELIILQKQHQKKKKQLELSKKTKKQVQDTFLNVKNSTSKRIITYQQFLNNKKQKQKEGSQKFRKIVKKNIQSAKQLIPNDQDLKRTSPVSNNLKEAQSRRDVAQSALKVIKRKHQTEINQLNSKLQFLRDENEELQIKLRQKIQQLKSAEIRFSQTKKNDPTIKVKQHRYSEPSF